MTDTFIVQDLFLPHVKTLIKSEVRPLTCHVCKKELNGMSITAKIMNGKTIFLCSHHLKSNLQQIVSVN